MSHIEQQEFCQSVRLKFSSFFEYKFVLDIGCLDINGNNNAFFSGCNYLGLDVAQGRNVDIITPGHELGMPDATFDTIVSTECFEHDQFYEKTIKNIYRMLKPGGLFLFTCATTGRPEHGTKRTTPDDAPLLQSFEGWSDYYKNLEEDDIKAIFDDFDSLFNEYCFSTNDKTKDLYFWGFKSGEYEPRSDYSFIINPENNAKNILEIKNSQEETLEILKKQTEEKVQYENKINSLESKHVIELEQLNSTLHDSQIELEQLNSKLHDSQIELLTIKKSITYRLTSPIRNFKHLLLRAYHSNKVNRVIRLSQLFYQNPKIALKAIQFVKKFGIKQTAKRLISASSLFIHAPVRHINIRDYEKIYILTTPHCTSLAKRIESSLAKISFESEVIFEKPKSGYQDTLYFVICPQMFTELPELYISYQLEQSVSSRWFTPEYFSILENSYAIFDYAENNINFLQENGLHYQQMFYMPVGYHKDLKSRIDEDYQYDVIFYGDINNARRKKYIEELSRNFNVKVIRDLFGEELYSEIAKAKVVVNIHYYENALLETTRIYESLSLNKLVISETSSDIEQHQDIKQCVDFVDIDDIEAMIARISYWIGDTENIKDKVTENISYLQSISDMFEFYFMRFMLSKDCITFDEFYELASKNIHFDTNFVCLGLPESTGRKVGFDCDNKYGIQYVPGLRHDLGWIGCGLSYKFIIRKAKEQNFETITICEDDVEFKTDFESRYQNIKNYLDGLENNSWDLFSGLIADFNSNTKVDKIQEYKEEEFIYIDKMTSTVLNVYSNAFFDKLLGWNDTNHDAETNTIDRYIENNGCKVITTPEYLVGHKEEMHSTLWGFNNSTYSEMIKQSSEKLNQKKDLFLQAK
ncbi:Methyltransferase type 11 [Psychromonas ingrahamii 37]|uniref:Methyltransferase type 11 n=1 Tax=Psychromonas ingrahamii (strain DSM 17664 / CCUG 51855 / 37) TaxID=357804 RepID=A1T077_PSYIN|nr:methyltransferase domain-containing protein [Psychromonas ingrahamii]ABM05142.1 Methyltransferase type 11 [Psychromonas ingrahamii 37]